MTDTSDLVPRLHDYTYDPFQEQAIAAVNGDTSILVAAPTGAGKTAIADHVIVHALAQGRHVIYTAPIKALSNQKYREFRAQYQDMVGIVTGDVVINAHAPLRIMTTEIYRNTLLDTPDQIEDAAWVIFDEVHYLDDEERGTVWEEAIMLTPPATRMLCLSATVPNVDELAAWMEEVLDRPTTVVVETQRPVPLHFRFQCQNQLLDSFRELKHVWYSTPHDGRSGRGRAGRRGHERDRRRTSGRRDTRGRRCVPNRLSQVMRQIRTNDELPCIYFAFGRRRTEELAEEVLGMVFLSTEEQDAVSARFQALCARYDITAEPSARRMLTFVRHGVAYHHAGMLPTLKEVVEQLFTARLLRLVFTTETFALGINMPARTVVFDNVRKYYASGFDTLHPRDFYQMAGRAGRRGMDAEGFVYIRLAPTRLKLDEVHHMLHGPHQPVLSQFDASYATLLNLYDIHGEQVVEMYPRTLHCFQASKRARKRARQRFAARLGILKAIRCIKGEQLTPKGHFARWMFGYELYLAELFEQGLLDRVDPFELSFALSCLVFQPRKGTHLPRDIPDKFGWVFRELRKVHRDVARLESKADVELSAEQPYAHLGGAIDLWLKGGEFDDAVEISRLDEGELVRALRMVIQLLRQLSQAPHTSNHLRTTARAARDALDRGVVDAERQLRA
jgi:superfamily II RNA helicase